MPRSLPPLAHAITPTKRAVAVVDLDDLFEGYEGEYVSHEDGFASAVGLEAM